MLRITIWCRILAVFNKKCLSLVLIGSDGFTFILFWSYDVYLLINLSNYPNILLSVFKVH